jgi:hypothetical protein
MDVPAAAAASNPAVLGATVVSSQVGTSGRGARARAARVVAALNDQQSAHKRFTSSALSALALCGAVCGARAALAAGATEPIRIEYHAEAGCPSADDFNAQVFRRTTSARLAPSGDFARTFVVTIGRRGGSLVGSLVVRQADGTTESREVAGPDCREVATVLALATALAIDPQASLTPAPEPAPSEKPPETPRAPEPRADVNPEPVEPSEPSGPEHRTPWSLALGPTLEGGITPGIAYGGSAGFGWRAAHADDPISAVGVDLTFLHSPRHMVGATPPATGGGSASFQLVYAAPTLCSVVLAWEDVSGIAPCVGAELGAVTGWGAGLPHSSTRSRAWAAFDLGLRLHQALGSSFFVEGDVSAVLPITRWTYVFREPDTNIFNVPSAAVTGALRLGARLW